ncbi:unnamed protein product, partial [Candidula unifasciata]
CSSLHHQTNLTDFCGFVKNTSSCDIDDGFINYTQLLYCSFSDIPIWLACIFLFIWWLFLFCGLAVTADDFFCPSLAVISESLRLSHNGVTFLAFGNGAPDIFSAIASIGNAKGGDAGLAIGALFGAGVFVTAVVAGSISIIKPFKSMERPFLRDVIFYLAATYWAWWVMWDKKITQMEAAGFIILYVVYVIVVVAGRYINQKLKKRIGQEISSVIDNGFVDALHDDNSSGVLESGVANMYRTSPGSNVQIEESTLLLHHTQKRNNTVVRNFLDDINPIVPEEWREKRCLGKMYEIFKSPLVLLLKLTVPVVSVKVEDDPEDIQNWNRLLNSVHVFTGPVFGIFVIGVGFNEIGGVFPIYGIVIIVCAILAVIVYFTSKTDERPVYHTAFAFLGFVVAVIWIYSIANEIVNILQAFGVVLDLSDAILGLTLLAWGNSIGDLIADTTMARQGYPRMGISACFGGPLFNLLLGLGIPFTIACFNNGGTFHLKITFEEMILAGGLAVSLISSLVIVTFSKFQMSRPYGIYLLCLYVAFLTVAVLTEVNIIPNFTL